MNELRLQWEPENLTPLDEIEERMQFYTQGKGGVTMMGNGTLLFLTDGDDPIDDARKALNEARFITDFRVVALKEGGYLVGFHDAVAVFVSDNEFERRRAEVATRQDELRFPGEVFFAPSDQSMNQTLLGLYARGKLQRDAYFFNFYKRL
jgi:hypothetical protein